jgi:hypothetical protein
MRHAELGDYDVHDALLRMIDAVVDDAGALGSPSATHRFVDMPGS